MGRLVKAFSDDKGVSEELRDEAAYLQTAGEAVARIQQELQNHAPDTAQPEHPVAPEDERSSADAAEDSFQHAADNPSQSLTGHTAAGTRERNGELNQDLQQRSTTATDPADAQNGLRLFVAPDDESAVDSVFAGADGDDREINSVQQKVVDEFIQEQQRWTERHAMQVRSIEERTSQLARIETEVELRERELDRRERELDARNRELASKAETEVRSRISRDWESAQQEMNRLTQQVRMHADRASQFEAELTEVRREHAIELDALRAQLGRHDDSRTDRAKSVIDECEQRMAELTAQRAAFQAEQSRRREELARERLEQRDELRQERQTLLAEHQAAQEAFEKDRDATIAQLERERREWNSRFHREQDELLDLKRTVEKEVEVMRADVARERAEWARQQEQIRAAQRREAELVAVSRAEAEQLKVDHETRFARLRKELESEREQWHRERGQEAAILQAERGDLDTEAERLRAERSRLETQRQQLAVELEQQRAEHDERIRQSWQEHQASLQHAEQESTSRQRVLAGNLKQRENELSARMKQAEHEISNARELCSRQIAQDRERFSQTCATQEAELERMRTELNAERQQFEREKREFADETQRARRKTEQERAALRETLAQMDSQLRTVAASLAPGIPVNIAESGLAESLQSLVDAAEDVTGETTIAGETMPRGNSEPGRDDVTSDEASKVQDHDGKEADAQTGVPEFLPVASKKAAAWEPGKDATLVESASDDLIRRVDAATEKGGVSGLQHRPSIARYGALADAVADVRHAEIIVNDQGRQPEWAGVVATRNEQTNEDTGNLRASDGDGRRQALESYRSKLSSLQDQLRQLSNTSTDPSDDDQSGHVED